MAAFVGNGQVQGQRLETIERLRLETLLMFGGGNVAVGQKDGIRGMIVAGVEGFELFVGEVGNRLGVAAAVVVIGDGREQPVGCSSWPSRCTGELIAPFISLNTTVALNSSSEWGRRLGRIPAGGLPGRSRARRAVGRTWHQVDIQQVVGVLLFWLAKGRRSSRCW